MTNATLDLWLVRHAESLGNVDRTEADTDLSERGKSQARALGSALAAHRFDRIWTSPLKRAVQTLASALPDAAPIVDARLAEFVPPVGTYRGFREASQSIAHTGIFRFAIRGVDVSTQAWNDTRHLGSAE